MGLDEKSIDQRKTILRIIEKSRRGHVASAFSVLEILRVLYDDILRVDSIHPAWEGRDRFVLSKGHGCLALYVQLAAKGFFPEEELLQFCEFDGILGGHPDWGKIPGVEASTGSLGHGFSIAVGMALAAKIDKKNHKVFVLLGDGECNEGTVWEAALSAAKHCLDNLIVLIDYNKMQCYSATSEVLELEPFTQKWKDFNCAVREVGGHDVEALKRELLEAPFCASKPSVLVCHTVKGKGIALMESNPAWHHKAKISEEEIKAMWDGLGKD